MVKKSVAGQFAWALTLAVLLASGAVLAGNCEIPGVEESNPDSAYVVHGDGTVTDRRTGLMWKQCAEGQVWNGSTCTGAASRHPWEKALELAEAHEFAGYGDWRMPTMKELGDQVESCRNMPTINVTIYPNTPDDRFWTGESASLGRAWYVDFFEGYVDYRARNDPSYFRLVRGGE